MQLSFLYEMDTDNYLFDIRNLLKLILKTLDKICYISFNMTGENVRIFCQENGINPEKLIIIDMVSPRFKDCVDHDNIKYLDLTDLSKATKSLISVIESAKCDSLIFDSLSSMRIYYEPNQMTKFVHELVVYSNSKKLVSNLIIHSKDNAQEWVSSLAPLTGAIKKVEFKKELD